MKKLKKFLISLFIVVIVLGFYNNAFNLNEGEIKDITFFELSEVVTDNKNKEMTLLEKESGEVILQIDDKNYITEVNPTDNNVKELLDEQKINYSFVEEVSFFDTFIKFAIPMFLLFLILGMIFNKNKGSVGKGNDMIKKNTKMQETPNTKPSDVGGLSEETREEVKQIIEIFKNKEKAKELGINPAKGALLHGPPGTGKTLLAKAMANELGASFYPTSGSSFTEMFVGVGASRVRELFAEARKTKPSLIFIDEFDSLAKKRGLSNSNEERENTLNELLAQLDGIESNEDVFLIAATNRLGDLDDAILRPGRFDYKIKIGLPDLVGRKEIISIHSKNKKLSEEVKGKLDLVAESTTGYSGAELEAVFNNAAKHALLRNKKEVDMDDINHALDVTVLGSANRKMTDEVTRKRVAYHEAGHALVGLITKPKSVRKATIIPRGDALGFVAPIPKELELSTPSELIDRLSMILAGGVAEMKKFGEHSIGVSGDVEQAKDLIGKMVDLGMREDDFVLSFDEKDKQMQMKIIFNKALKRSKDIIEKYENEWEKLTSTLLLKETLTGEEIEKIIHNLPDVEFVSAVKLEKEDSKAENKNNYVNRGGILSKD